MRVHILSIFPDMFPGPLSAGIMARAQRSGLVEIHVHNPRDFATDRHRSVDDAPFGGGPGMVMRPEPLFEAVESLSLPAGSPVLLMSPQGRLFTQRDAERLSRAEMLVLICGRYEGVDDRVATHLTTEEVSVGDYVLTGGELPALTIVDAVVRLLPGALGHGEEALPDDSHTSGLLQYPQYTRPSEYRGWGVPEVLLSGNHQQIAKWRRRAALLKTLERRPDLLRTASLSADDRAYLRGLGWTEA
ncbi:MAG: tRNA (guanosine(37)-N1)-methyltransferase TrmD [SAR202 cluster bacterium]|nr:tRNA (guanosine(37)-N1)-methyltransferase TrmD [SAR202 cluster bacterium]